MGVNCRLIQPVGVAYRMISTLTVSQEHYHRAERPITKEDFDRGLPWCRENLYKDSRAVCETCEQLFNDPNPGIGQFRVWDTEDGKPNHSGDMYYAPWLLRLDGKDFDWDSVDPKGHLIVVLPNGVPFDMDQRASNCASPKDHNHRCWSRTGTPPNITLGPGCGSNYSIQGPGWHGHLRNGVLEQA